MKITVALTTATTVHMARTTTSTPGLDRTTTIMAHITGESTVMAIGAMVFILTTVLATISPVIVLEREAAWVAFTVDSTGQEALPAAGEGAEEEGMADRPVASAERPQISWPRLNAKSVVI